jgi:hypothetical protein
MEPLGNVVKEMCEKFVRSLGARSDGFLSAAPK